MSFPAIGRKKITAAFDGGRLTFDGGVLLLAQAARAMGICRRLAGYIADPRDPSRVVHRLDDILRARVLAIACGYEMPTTLMPCAMIRVSAWRSASCRARAPGLPVSRR